MAKIQLNKLQAELETFVDPAWGQCAFFERKKNYSEVLRLYDVNVALINKVSTNNRVFKETTLEKGRQV